MEGSVVWINMFGELWRASVEQTRGNRSRTPWSRTGGGELHSEMQERLKRSAHRPGFRDVTSDSRFLDDVVAGNEVDEDEARRGLPLVRFAEEDEVQDVPQAATPGEDHILEEEDDAELRELFEPPEQEGRRRSRQTVGELDEEAQVVEEHNEADQQAAFDQDAHQVAAEAIASSVQGNETLDGLPEAYGRARAQVARWDRTQPYLAEFFLAEEADTENAEEPKQDYWVYDWHRQVLQRRHVHWRRQSFNPSSASNSPIPLRALRKTRRTRTVTNRGVSEEVRDEWSLFAKREERRDWWRGITEFDVDYRFLANHGGMPMAKKRGEGEVFPREISAEEWPEWEAQDKAEMEKIIASGALRVLNADEEKKVMTELKEKGQMDRILPTGMVRRSLPVHLEARNHDSASEVTKTRTWQNWPGSRLPSRPPTSRSSSIGAMMDGLEI